MLIRRITSAANSDNPDSLANQLRLARFARFQDLADRSRADDGTVRILDLGGTAMYWENMGVADRPDYKLTTLNIVEPTNEHPTIRQLQGDATDTDFSDDEFDVVFSNSVIEHVGGLDKQRAMAREIRRLAPSYYVQTPCRSFPIEPHHRSPFCHPYLPHAVRVREMQRIRKTHRFEAEWIINSVNLMKSRDFAQAFPDANITRERVFGLTKSWMAIRIRQPQ